MLIIYGIIKVLNIEFFQNVVYVLIIIFKMYYFQYTSKCSNSHVINILLTYYIMMQHVLPPN